MRTIIHIDMDAFFAAIEQLDRPEWRGKPVIVGGDPAKRGVVSTASYEARPYGVRSAMPAATARALCPDAIFVRPRMERYATVSREIMSILDSYSNLVEKVSIDEAYLDVTASDGGPGGGAETARLIKRDILERTSLTASAGVAPNKFIAKIASDMDKPAGLVTVPPEGVADLLEDLPAGKVPGIGPVTAARMAELGVTTVGQLRAWSLTALAREFGRAGAWYHALARGEDHRPVTPDRVRKSIGAETTFEQDLSSVPEMEDRLASLAQRVAGRMERAEAAGRTITLKLTYAGYHKVTRSASLDEFVSAAEVLAVWARRLLRETEAGARPVRLLGITVSNLRDEEPAAAPAPGAGEQMLLPRMGDPAPDSISRR